jgi:tetratricopeptide (TPR) repeat protein
MSRIEKTVFVSYRRTNAPWALAIFQNLTQHGFDVFFDFAGIASGDFESVILANIRQRAHFLVVLTPSALERCGDPGDWLRREIETALALKRNIVPLMLEGFDFGSAGIANQLTGTLVALKNYNALRIPAEYFDEAMSRLREKFLNVPLEAVLHPASLAALQGALEQKAAATAAPAVAEKELTAQEWFERALKTADMDERIRFNTEAIHLKPDYSVAFHNRGSSRWEQGDFEGAWRDYTEAIRIKPDLVASYVCRGNLLLECGDIPLALQDYDEAIRLDPNDGEAYCRRGIAHQKEGDTEGALQDFDEAIRLSPNDYRAYDERGTLRREAGDLDGALRDHNEAVRLGPDNYGAYNNRGLARWSSDDLKGAEQDFSEAIRLHPDDPYMYDNRGNLRIHKGDLDGAVRDFSEAIRLLPDKPTTAHFYAHRSQARKAKGDLKGAAKDHKEAIRLNPELEQRAG